MAIGYAISVGKITIRVIAHIILVSKLERYVVQKMVGSVISVITTLLPVNIIGTRSIWEQSVILMRYVISVDEDIITMAVLIGKGSIMVEKHVNHIRY
jgi:hypothetical protein